MATKTINDYDEVTSLSDDDLLLVYLVASNVTRKLEKSNLFVSGAAFGARVDVNYANRAIFAVAPTTSGTTSSGEVAVSNNGATAIGYIRSNDAAHTDARWGLTVGGYTEFYTAGAASNGMVVGTQTADPLIFGTANTERARVDASGNIILAANTHIYTSQSTYTPTVTGSGSNPTVSYGTRTGYYKKIDNIIWFTFNCPITSASGGSGNIQINLPSIPAYAGSAAAGGTVAGVATLYDGADYSWTFTTAGAIMTLHYNASALAVNYLYTGATLRGTGFYFV